MSAMSALNITKVAVGCASLADLERRQKGREEGGTLFITTRYRPKRYEELVGGSIYWIIKHRLVVRQRIIAFEEAADGRWNIRLDAKLIPVRARPKRAHQGWRYLKASDAPKDFEGDEDGLAALPSNMLNDLARLALI
ncbi:DUF1489 domain-containing protein [uncultured Parasphingopyxis sp.]|uniref:DUF1489 family protein n=1 Tax=uncultured Parasphingopyxis sp. TaxID=1547918 RepID=UPI002611E8AB|nr:DUF1489 domain-containing protein [uncultured Parasphingopyxis sp.]